MIKQLSFALVLTVILTAVAFHPKPVAKTVFTAPFLVDTVASALVVPWDIVFTPDSCLLFTERPGRVRRICNGVLESNPLLTLTDIEVRGKMGLLGMRLHPQFSTNHFIYLAYNYRQDNETFVRINRYILSRDSLTQPKLIIEKIPGVYNHTGCRMVFGKDNKLFITTGDADIPKEAQNLKAYNGKILRLNDDGSIPADNPFVHNDTARHEIWTYGHRNPQGIVFQPGTGNLYSSEHGPTGGDEINLISRGHNYGWPLSHHRENHEGMTAPLLEFTPSIGPAEAIFYSGKIFPDLKGHLLVGCMRGEAILDISFANNAISKYDFLFKKRYGRIRAVAEGPDGSIYFSTSQVDMPESNTQQGERGYDLILRARPAASDNPADTTQITTPPGQPAIFHVTATTTTAKPDAPAVTRNTVQLYTQLCASCHGADLKGIDKTPSLVDKDWLHGGTRKDLQQSISNGFVAKGMPAWSGVLSPKEIQNMASYILHHKH